MRGLGIELGDGSVEELTIAEGERLLLGRDDGCDVVLPSPDVSRRHGIVFVRDGVVWFEDQSANGTRINGGEVLFRQSIALGPGTRVQVGPYFISVLPEAGVSEPAEGQFSSASSSVRSLYDMIGREMGRTPTSRAYGQLTTRDIPSQLRREILQSLLEHLDLVGMKKSNIDVERIRPRVREALTVAVRAKRRVLPADVDLGELIDELADEALGLGPLEALVADDTVSEIMVVDPTTIFIERNGSIEHTGLRFSDNDSVRSCIERIVTPLGRRIDEASPMVDARLPDGSRVNAVIPPLALRGPCITIRKFRKKPFSVHDLIRLGTLDERMAKFLVRCVITKRNILVSGGTGSGKTTLLNVLSSAIPETERVVTIEDSAELRLNQPHVVSLETRPPNLEGKGQITIRDLVRNALRMRPDRIVVGECRGGEALDMLQAMNTGHDGSMTTLHANNPQEAVTRLEALVLMSGLDLPLRSVREQISRSVHVILQQARLPNGLRKITSIAEVTGMSDAGEIELREIFQFHQHDGEQNNETEGEFRATGYLPSFLDDFINRDLVIGGDYL